MQLSHEELEEFKRIYREEFDTELSDEKTLELATSVFNLMKVVYRPLPTGVGFEPKTNKSSNELEDFKNHPSPDHI
jgi:hypothetical protein